MQARAMFHDVVSQDKRMRLRDGYFSKESHKTKTSTFSIVPTAFIVTTDHVAR